MFSVLGELSSIGDYCSVWVEEDGLFIKIKTLVK